jgi:ligand-binding SRPBCC domain-containing protein
MSGEASIVIAPAARGHELRAAQWVPQPRDRVFPFFADPLNLERLTPPFLRFHVRRQSTTDVRAGTLLTYTLRLHGLPIVWRTRIDEWRPPERFADTQLFGPYAEWHHTHLFDDDGAGTRLTDIVRYRLHLGVLMDNRLMSWVHRDVRRIFEYRQAVIAELFGPPRGDTSDE